MSEIYRYRPEVLERLAGHGLCPRLTTQPDRVREAVYGLYCHELRVLRARLKAREFPMTSYAARVVDLKARYPVLSVPLADWVL